MSCEVLFNVCEVDLIIMQDFDERVTIDMAEICSQIDPKTMILTVHGDKDATIPIADAHSFAERLPGKKLTVIEGGDHNFSQKQHSEQLIKILVAFFTSP